MSEPPPAAPPPADRSPADGQPAGEPTADQPAGDPATGQQPLEPAADQQPPTTEPRYERFDCADPEEREIGVKVALAALARGELAVLPTDTVYGIATDAFSPSGVSALLAAKGRGRDMPVPVLLGTMPTLHALALTVSGDAAALVEAFWPGPLTIVCAHQPSLAWDLGDARGTVALRMPDQPLALEMLRRHGPLAVSSANRSGLAAATTCAEAMAQLGDRVPVYLDDGATGGAAASTIVDLTGDLPRVLRVGALSLERLRQVVPGVLGTDGSAPA